MAEYVYVPLAGTVTGHEITGLIAFNDGSITMDTGNITLTSGNITLTNGGFYQSSDDNLKDYKGELNLNLEDITKIPTKLFTFKNDPDKKEHIGTSAQELQKICPELVTKGENGYLAVDYAKLSIVALKGLKLLKEENEKLKKELSELEK